MNTRINYAQLRGEHLRNMHERPRGQKNPSQQGRGNWLRTGSISLFRFAVVNCAAAHPDSHCAPHDEELQFRFGFGASKLAFWMLSKYNWISLYVHRRADTVPSVNTSNKSHPRFRAETQ